MKVLFVCFEFCENRDAGSQCIQKLREELWRRHISSDILTYAWSKKTPKQMEDLIGHIYTAKTWYRFSRVKRNANGQIQMSFLQWMQIILIRGIAVLLEGVHFTQRGIPLSATKQLQKKLKSLCKENIYDWVIAVSHPFANHMAVLNACAGTIKVALYNLDPYWNNQTYSSKTQETRIREEIAAYKKANHIFCTPEQMSDYQNEYFSTVQEKITPLNYPNFVEPRISKLCSIRFDPQKINLLYLGAVYSDIRKPDALLRLFEQAVRQEPKLHLYIIGKKFGPTAEQYLVEYEKRLQDNLTIAAPVPIEETDDLMQQADVLVNLGNTMHNQMPSKTLTYLATGKPILNISAITDCNTLPIISRYPLAFQYWGEELCARRIEDFVQFCRKQKGNALLWQEVSAIYPEMQISNIADRFLCILDGKEKMPC